VGQRRDRDGHERSQPERQRKSYSHRQERIVDWQFAQLEWIATTLAAKLLRVALRFADMDWPMIALTDGSQLFELMLN